MQLKHFIFAVEFEIAFSGKDLNILQTLSQHHYDGKCQAASAQGGFIYGLMNSHNFRARRQTDSSLGSAATMPTPYMDEITDHRLTWDEVDTLAKIAEMERYAPREFAGLNFTLMQMLKDARHISAALNNDEGRKAVDDMALAHFEKHLGT